MKQALRNANVGQKMIETIAYVFSLSFNCMGATCKLKGSGPNKKLIKYSIARIIPGVFKIKLKGSQRIWCSLRDATRRKKPVHGYMYPKIITAYNRKAEFVVETWEFKRNKSVFVNSHFDFNCSADFDKGKM